MPISHYDTLRIQKNATDDEIDNAARIAIAEIRMNPVGADFRLAAVRNAVATLKDPAMRAAYDAGLGPPLSAAAALPNKPKAETDNDRARTKLYICAALISGLILGYFVGREHLKYQMQSAMTEALGGLATNLGKALGGGETKSPERKQTPSPSKASKSFPITITFLRKGWVEEKYGSKLTMELSFANGTGRDVRAFDGRVIFTDLLGNEILVSRVAINEQVAAGQSLSWTGSLDYNQFMRSHTEFRGADKENMKVAFELNRVLFVDGETKDF